MQKNPMKDTSTQKMIQDQSNRLMQSRKEQKDVFQENFRLDQSKVVNKPHFENQAIQLQPQKKDQKLLKENTVSLGFNNQLMSMPSFGPAVGQFKSHQPKSNQPQQAIIAQSLSSQMHNNFYNHQIQEQNSHNKFSPALRNQTGTGYFVQNPDNSVLDNTYPSPKLRMIAQKPDESMISNLQFDRLNTSHFQLKPYFQVQDQQKAINFNEISYMKDNKMINEDQYQNFHLQQQNISIHNQTKRQQLPKKYQILNLQHAHKGSKLSNAQKQESEEGGNISSDDMNIDTLSSQCDLTQSNSGDKEFDKSQSMEENGPEKNQEKLQFHDNFSQLNAIQYTPYQYPGYEYNLKYLNNELNLFQSKNVLNKSNNQEKDGLTQTMVNKKLQPFQFKKQANQGYPLQSEHQLIPNDKSSGFDTGRTNYQQNKFNVRQFPNQNQYNNANGWNTQRGRASPLDMFNDPNQMANTDRQRFIENRQTQGNQKQQSCYEYNGCLNQRMYQQQQYDQNKFYNQAQQYQQPFYKQNEVPSPFLNQIHDFPHHNLPPRNTLHNFYQMQNLDVRFSQFQQQENLFENENYNIPQTSYVHQRNQDNSYPNNQQIIDKLEYQDKNKATIQVPIYYTKSSTIQQNKNSAINSTPQSTYFQKLYQKIQEDSERIAQYSKRNQEDNTLRLKSKSPQEILKQKRKQDYEKIVNEIQTPSDYKQKMRQTTNQNSYDKSVKIRGSKSVENLSVIEKNSSSLNYNEMVTQGNELCVLFDYDKQQRKNQQKSSEIGRNQQDSKINKSFIIDQEIDEKNQFELTHQIKSANIEPNPQLKLSYENQQLNICQKSPDEMDQKDQNKKNPTNQKIHKDIKRQNISISSTTKVNTSTDKVLSRVNSMRIQDQLLSHVKQNGFKEGFNNQKNQDSKNVGFELKVNKKISQFSRKKSQEQVREDKQNNSQSSDEINDQKESKNIIEQKQKKKTQNIIFNNSPKQKSSQDDKKQNKEIFEWDLKVKINNQPVEVNRLTQTPLGQLMNKIGLQLTTGDHLNKLLVQKTRSIEANLRSHSEGDNFSQSNYAALMSTSQDFSNQKINESKKEIQKASVKSKKLKSRQSSKQNTVLNKVDSRKSSQVRILLKQQELNKINETGEFLGQNSKVLGVLSDHHISDIKSYKSHSSHSITRQLNNYVINAPVTPVQEPKFVQQKIKLQNLQDVDPNAFKTPQATSRKPVNQVKNIVTFAQTNIQLDNFVAKTPQQTKKSKPQKQIIKATENEDASQKQSLENQSDYSGLPQIQRKQENSVSDISLISHLLPVKSQSGWEGQTQMDHSEISKFRCPDRKAENSQSDVNSMYSNNLVEQKQIDQQKKPTSRFSQNIISNNLVDVIDWDVKTVINKPKDYDNSSQQTLQQPLKRIQENSVSDISALSQFGRYMNQPINWDAKTANNKIGDNWASSPLLPPTKRLIEKTNSEISQSYVNTFKTPFMEPRKFSKNTEIEEQSSIGPMPRVDSKRRMQEKSVSDISAPIQNSPFLTLKRDLMKEQLSAKQPQHQYFKQVYNSKAFETEEGLGQKIDYFHQKKATTNTSQSLSSQQNFKSNSNSQSNQLTIATIQGQAETGVTIVNVPDQVDNNTFGLNQQLKKLMRQSQDKFQKSSNKIEIKYNGSFQLNKDSLIKSQTSQHKSQHSNHSDHKEEKKHKLQRADTFANLEGSIQNQSVINQAKSQQFKSNEIEEKAMSEKSISDQTEETKEQQIIIKTIF